MKKLLLLLASAVLVVPMTTLSLDAQNRPTKVPKLSEVPNKKALARWNARTPQRSTMQVDLLKQVAANPFGRLQKASANDAIKAQDFKCALLNRSTWDEDYPPYGAYAFSTTDLSEFSRLYMNMDAPANAGGFFTEDKYYFTSYVSDEWGWDYTVTTYIINTNTWKKETSIEQGSMYAMAYDLAYDPIEKVAYGSFYNGSEDEGSAWGYMDLEGNVTKIDDIDNTLVAVASTALGQIYAVTEEGNLVTVDKHTGKLDVIGYTRLTPSTSVRQSAAFASDGTLYWAVGQDSGTGLVTVNTETGEASLVGVFENYEIVAALYAEAAAAAEGAPLEVTDLALNFVDDALSGTVSFGVPAQDNQGETIVGDVTYIINVDGTDVVTGTAAAGTTVNAEVTVAAAGTHVFAVRLQNSKGDSQAISDTRWIGIDRPVAVTDLKLEKTAPLQASLSWTAPTKGAQDGFFDAARISYNVYRLPEGKLVAEKIKETSFVDNLETDGKVYLTYKVVALADDAEGEAAESNGIVFGNSLNVPVTFDFSTEADYNIFTIIDVNENLNQDDGLWQYTASGECAGYVAGTLDGDDWLITPEINLKADRQYTFSYNTLCYSDYWPDQYEVFMGREATVAAMTTQLVASTQIYWEDYRTTVLTITVPEDGTYNFGFHALSEAGGAFFLVDDISVEEGLMLKAPLTVTNLKVVAGAKAAPTATVSFTAPTKAVDGSDLTALTSIKVYRGGKVVKEFSAPAAGASLSFEESNLPEEEYAVYNVVAASAAGESAVAADSAWIGQDAPSEPTVHIAVVGGHPVLTWDAPTGVGQHGGYFDASNLTYIVYDVANGSILASDLKANTYTVENYTVKEDGEQALKQYAVFAANGDDLIGYPGSNFVIEGEKYALPFKESFAGGKSSNLLLISSTITDQDGYDKWALDDDYNTSSQDGDGGSIMVMPATPGVQSTIQMGKIDMSEAKNSTLTFYLKRMAYDYDYMETDPKDDYLNVYVGGADYETKLVKTVRPYELKKDAEYEKFTVPLTEYEGSDFIYLQFQLNADAAYYALVLDNVQVRSNYNVNLQTTGFTVPAQVDVTRDFEASVEVTNDGAQPATNFTIDITADGKTVASQVVADTLAAGEVKAYDIQLNAAAAWNDTVKLVAEVTIAADEVAEDDAIEATLLVIRPEVDGVKDLAATLDGTDATFTWTAPAIPEAERVTDSFEDYTHGARKDFGEWSVIDADGAYGYNADLDLPGYFGTRAFTVVNVESAGADDWGTHSGKQIVAAISNWDNENDDWLISPALSGEAQTISFWARGLNASVDEIYVYYSTDGTTVADFKASRKLDDSRIALTKEWTKYSFELPAGAKYFAIRYYVDYGEGALIDDIEFEKKASFNVQPVIEGYNLYLDGEKLNDEVIADTTYTVSDVKSGDYYVIVVYNVGESAASNKVSVTATAIEAVKTDAESNEFPPVYDLLGRPVNELLDGQMYIKKGQKVVYQVR